MSEELKPCPICEGQYLNVCAHGGTGKREWHIECDHCGCACPTESETEAEAYAAWNALPRRLKWTREKPTQDGFYWCRFRRPNVMIRWFAMVLVNAKGRYGVTVGSSDIHNIDSYDDAEWAGPIPEPMEAE